LRPHVALAARTSGAPCVALNSRSAIEAQPRIDIFPDQVFIDALAQHLQAQRRDGGQLGMSGNIPALAMECDGN
jgi:hypothetical protein